MSNFSDYLKLKRIDPVAAMNALQNAGIVSDNCESAEDVPDSDAARAMAWLRDNGGKW